MPDWGRGLYFFYFRQNGSLVSKNKASKKTAMGKALLLYALRQELEILLIVPSVSTMLLQPHSNPFELGLHNVVNVWKPVICTGLGKMCQSEHWASPHRCCSHSGMGGPTTLSTSQWQFTGDVPSVVAAHSHPTHVALIRPPDNLDPLI